MANEVLLRAAMLLETDAAALRDSFTDLYTGEWDDDDEKRDHDERMAVAVKLRKMAAKGGA